MMLMKMTQRGNKIAESADQLSEQDKMLLAWKDVSLKIISCFPTNIENLNTPHTCGLVAQSGREKANSLSGQQALGCH
jgi:hypothetical protein